MCSTYPTWRYSRRNTDFFYAWSTYGLAGLADTAKPLSRHAWRRHQRREVGIRGAVLLEFRRRQMDRAEVLGVEVRQFRGENLTTLVPRVVGRTATATARKSSRQDKRVEIGNDAVIVCAGGVLPNALLERIARRGFAVGRRPIEIGPLESLWTAWRSARQH